MFVFGTQYLRGATPERDQWEKDMHNMRKLGFNTIRAWLVWNAIEKREGEIDYDYIDSFLTLAKKYELNVGLLFHLHACPQWAADKFSKYFYVNEDNLPFEPAVRPNTPGGGWPGLCFDNPEVRDMEQSLIERVISHTKNYDNVAFYEPMNEPHSWVNIKRTVPEAYCYCDASVKKFRIWLKNKYEDIEILNKGWGTFYNTFDEIRPPRWYASFSDYVDWRIFTSENIVEELKFRTDIIKKCDNKPVIAHSWGGGCTSCGLLGDMAFDDWKNASVFDKWGYSAFPSDTGKLSNLGLGCDATRCSAQGKEFWQSELGAGLIGTNLRQQGRIDDNSFDKFSLESIRHGAKGLLYWQYRKERYGLEFGGYSMTDYNGGPTNLTARASKLCKMLGENEDSFKNAKQKKAQVALVFSIRSYFADWASNGKMDNRFAVDSMSGYYKMFWEENITTDIIHEEFATNLDDYKLIVLPSPYAIHPGFAAKLKEYVKNGGCVISDPYFGAFDETMKLSRFVPGYDSAEMFGCCENDMRMQTNPVLCDGKRNYKFNGNRHKELFKNITGEVLYTYDDGNACIVSNNYGKGRAVISGINLGLSYSNRGQLGDDLLSEEKENSSAGSKEIVLKIAYQQGVEKNICNTGNIQVTYMKAEDDSTKDILIVINNSGSNKKGTIKLDKNYESCKDVFGSTKCTLADSCLEFDIGADSCGVITLSN